MHFFKLKYENGNSEIVKAENFLAAIEKYNLYAKKHINTRISELSGEQLLIAVANEEE